MEWFLLAYLLCEEENKDFGSTYFGAPSSYIPTKMDKWLEKHKIIDRIWPYVLGVVLGLMPLWFTALMWVIFAY